MAAPGPPLSNASNVTAARLSPQYPPGMRWLKRICLALGISLVLAVAAVLAHLQRVDGAPSTGP